jgi:hypothetical protein
MYTTLHHIFWQKIYKVQYLKCTSLIEGDPQNISNCRPIPSAPIYVAESSLSPRRYPYFDVVVGLVWSHDPKSYAGGSVCYLWASHARQVKGDDPDKKGYPGPPGWWFGVGEATPHSKKLIVTKLEKMENLDGFNDDGESW